MKRLSIVAYGAACYLIFALSFLYAIGFVGDFAVPRTIDDGLPAPTGEAIIVNLVLLLVFAVPHSVMARPAFKRWWTRFVSPTIERSNYVLSSSLLLFLLFWQWRTMPTVIWDVQASVGRLALWALFWLGWATVFASTFMINHFDLFGLRQVYLAWRGKPYSDIEFRTTMLYRLVRHPLLLGFIIAFWAIPTMTVGHLLFAAVWTAYILVAIQLEERDTLVALGEPYRAYRERVPMLVPNPARRRRSRQSTAS